MPRPLADQTASFIVGDIADDAPFAPAVDPVPSGGMPDLGANSVASPSIPSA